MKIGYMHRLAASVALLGAATSASAGNTAAAAATPVRTLNPPTAVRWRSSTSSASSSARLDGCSV